MLAFLQARSVRATFFILGEVASRYPHTVADIRAEGHEIACHGFRHLPVELMSRRQLEDDLDRAIDAIGAVTGERPAGYRAPFWSLSRAVWGLDVLISRRFAYDSSLVPVPVLGTASLPERPVIVRREGGAIVELPPLTGRFGPWRFPLGFGLGLRLLPAGLLKRAIAAENRAGAPAVLAFHPWEMDPDPPALRLAPSLAVAHGFGIDKLRCKLEALMEQVPLRTAREALGLPGTSEAAA